MNFKQITFVAACICLPVTAWAQSDPGVNKPAIATPSMVNPAAPATGENSFTEDQARSRMEEAGFSNIMGLTLDKDGVWQANGEKDGASVSIQLDYQGNITTEELQK